MDVYHDLVDDKRVIVANGFRFTYENSRASSLLVEDLQISSGQLVVLCGKSGSGKSTFLRLINGLIPDYYEGKLDGQLEIADQSAGKQTVEECSKRVASVFQNRRLRTELCVFLTNYFLCNPHIFLGKKILSSSKTFFHSSLFLYMLLCHRLLPM